MSLLYRPLFNIKFFHEFYKNNNDKYTHVDEDITVSPTPECAKELANQGLLLRITNGGFTVLYRAHLEDNIEKPLIPLTEPRKFSFQLFPKKPDFIYYSSLPLDGKNPGIFYLSNLEDNIQSNNGTQELLLVKDHSKPYLSSLEEFISRPSQFSYQFKKAADSALLTVEDRQANIVYSKTLQKLDDGATTVDKNFTASLNLSARKSGLYTLKVDAVEQEKFYLDGSLTARPPFGLIDIFYHPDVPVAYQFADSAGNVASKTYIVRLNNRETIWKYLVALKYREDLNADDLEIVSDIFPATFTRQPSYMQGDNLTVIPFDSGSTTLPLKKEPLKGIKLKRTISNHGHGHDDDQGHGNSSTEETALPNPQISNIKTANDEVYSEVYIYV
jgi:hypothetical protein